MAASITPALVAHELGNMGNTSADCVFVVGAKFISPAGVIQKKLLLNYEIF